MIKMYFTKRFNKVDTIKDALLIVCGLVENKGLENYAINYKNGHYIVRYNTIY